VAQPAPSSRPEPLFLGRYRAVRQLGSGGSGSVWLSRDERTGREVAVKVVPRRGKTGPRARREAQALASLEHPRCLRVYACGRDAESVYIAYEYVPGRTLREALRAGEVRDDDAVEAAAQALEALAHAHARGIVHRDVKPANVLLADADSLSVRLLDFGLARVAEADTLTAAGDVPGTLAYIAPERLHGEPASPAGDVYSVGVLLHEALAGSHPFWRPSLAETAEAITDGAPPLARLRPDLPQPLLAAVDRALDTDPARRPSAAKLAKVLRRSRDGGAASLDGIVQRFVPPALAALYAGAAASFLPFFPAHWPGVLAALVAVIAFLRPRAGLAAALAVPILPLGNVALALAVLYAAAAMVWLLLHAREPERGLAAPLGVVPGLLPLAYHGARSSTMRALGAGGAVLFGAAALAVRDGDVGLGLAGSRAPLAAAEAIVGAVPGALALEAAGVALAALLLPWAARKGRWGVAVWGAATLSLALLHVPAAPLVVGVWLTCGALLARTYTG
jgi:eukaryotic-like serine/threonine-protein kinase